MITWAQSRREMRLDGTAYMPYHLYAAPIRNIGCVKLVITVLLNIGSFLQFWQSSTFFWLLGKTNILSQVVHVPNSELEVNSVSFSGLLPNTHTTICDECIMGLSSAEN